MRREVSEQLGGSSALCQGSPITLWLERWGFPQSINQSDFTLKTTQQILFGDPPFKVQAYFYLHRLSWSVFAAEIWNCKLIDVTAFLETSGSDVLPTVLLRVRIGFRLSIFSGGNSPRPPNFRFPEKLVPFPCAPCGYPAVTDAGARYLLVPELHPWRYSAQIAAKDGHPCKSALIQASGRSIKIHLLSLKQTHLQSFLEKTRKKTIRCLERASDHRCCPVCLGQLRARLPFSLLLKIQVLTNNWALRSPAQTQCRHSGHTVVIVLIHLWGSSTLPLYCVCDPSGRRTGRSSSGWLGDVALGGSGAKGITGVARGLIAAFIPV